MNVSYCVDESDTILYHAAYVRLIGYDRQSKGKTIPLQAWTGPEGSRSLRFPDIKTIGTRMG
jgi:hypothetical protein